MIENERSPAARNAIPFSEDELLRKALRSLPKLVISQNPRPLWALVMSLFDCTPYVARLICWRYDFDPEEIDHIAHLPSLSYRDIDNGK